MSKSYVSIEQHLCVVCGKAFETNSLLLDKRLRDSMEKHTVTGMGVCPEHQKLADDGYLALIECDPARSLLTLTQDTLKQENAYRTGKLCHIKRHLVAKIFDTAIDEDQILVFVEPGVIDKIESMMGMSHDGVGDQG